jgi:hypothetical protein
MNTPKRKTEANHLTFLHGLDPQRSLKFTEANVRFRIAKLTLPRKRPLCAAATGAIFRFMISKRTIAEQSVLVAC